MQSQPSRGFLVHLQRHASARPDAIALVIRVKTSDQRLTRLTWRELLHAARRTSNWIQLQFSSAHMIGHLCDNRLADILIWLACQRQGWVDAPVDARLPVATIDQMRTRIGGAWLDNGQRDEIEQITLCQDPKHVDAPHPPPQAFDDPALLLWTSGTTALPKGVLLTAGGQYKNAAAKLAAVPQTVGDVRLTVLPISHAYARTCDLGTWLISGCTLAIASGYAGWCDLASEVRPTISNLVPSLARRLLDDAPEETGTVSLRLIGCSGAGMDAATYEGWNRRGVVVIQGYGQTETGPVICSATPQDARFGWVGNLVDGWELQVVDGRLKVRGSANMVGYWNDPEATASKIDAGGWLDTGDQVQRDDETGQFRILGRNDDVIVMPSGQKVFPETVERQLCQVAVIHHALVRIQDGQLVAWLDVKGSVRPQELQSQIREVLTELASWQRPRLFLRIPVALTTESGTLTAKGTIRRNEIVQRYEDRCRPM